MPCRRKVRVLLIEDNGPDIALARMTFKPLPSVELIVVEDGQEALDYLYRKNQHYRAPRPHLILLDLNLPKYDGLEILDRIKADPTLRRIPVVVLTSSRQESDILRAYDLHANAYVVKPLGLDKFTQALKQLQRFWLETASLPRNGR